MPTSITSKELIEKSVQAAVSAIELYNKPDFRYREESFAEKPEQTALQQGQPDVTYDFVYVDEESFKKYKTPSFRQLVDGFREYKEKV